MKSLSCPPSAAARSVFADALVPRTALDAVQGSDCGALVCFEGRVRKIEEGRPIVSLTYEAYGEMAEKEIEKIVRAAERRWGVRARVLHRVGKVGVEELAFFVACAGAHRPETFAACQHIVDKVKASAPIWKVRFEWTALE